MKSQIASSAEGATFTSKPGAAPQGYENQKNISAESAIHFRRHQLDQRQLNRAFSACLHGDLNSWALPQVRHGEWSRRDASDMDGLSREAERSGSE